MWPTRGTEHVCKVASCRLSLPRTVRLLLNAPIQVAFRCMGIRGQEIWTGQGPTDRRPKKPGKTRTRLRGIFADADAIARRKVR